MLLEDVAAAAAEEEEEETVLFVADIRRNSLPRRSSCAVARPVGSITRHLQVAGTRGEYINKKLPRRLREM